LAAAVLGAGCSPAPPSDAEPLGTVSEEYAKVRPGATVEGIDVYDGDGAIGGRAAATSLASLC
jgi:hypothetical protein